MNQDHAPDGPRAEPARADAAAGAPGPGDAQTRSIHRPDGRRIEASIRVAAPPERVWRAWTDPSDLSRWFTDRARGEAVPGGTITWIFDEFDVEIPYPVTVAEPGRRLVLAGELPERGPFALEVRFEAEGEGTVVRLVNSGFLDGAEWDEEYRGVASGWRLALALLKHYLERHADRPKRTILLVRPVPTPDPGRFFGDAAGLARWLTRSGGLGDEGSSVALELHDGSVLTGHVLARTPTEVALSWQEEDAALELKAFRRGAQPVWGVRLTAWDMTDERARELRESLDEAVERLARVAAEEAGGPVSPTSRPSRRPRRAPR